MGLQIRTTGENKMSAWIEQVAESMPEYAEDIAANLLKFMATPELDEFDAHACALAAAVASGNGGLAFEIDMNSPITGLIERHAAKAAAINTVQDSMYMSFDSALQVKGWNALNSISYTTPGFSLVMFDSAAGVSRRKFAMYSLSAAIVTKELETINYWIRETTTEGLTQVQIREIAKIAAVIGSIGKIVI